MQSEDLPKPSWDLTEMMLVKKQPQVYSYRVDIKPKIQKLAKLLALGDKAEIPEQLIVGELENRCNFV